MKKNNIQFNYNLRPSDPALFRQACDRQVLRMQHADGIGTLGEKSVHSVLKYYYLPRPECHEIPIGRFVADACCDGEIFEIQSRGFHSLKGRLSAFLKDYDVTIVYPIAAIKWLRYIDPDTGEILPPKKSPKKGHPYDVFRELLNIRDFLPDPRFHLILCLLETEEYIVQDGFGKNRRRHATKADKIPLNIIEEISLAEADDYLSLLPCGFTEKESFTTMDLSEASGRSLDNAQCFCYLLKHLGLITSDGKQGRYNLYRF